ncbi:hypothetical protein GQ43DRAFT_369103 [Delitschia confertaspora ATCC 74209]|uniref:Guided entry of tail-anchored proteins 1 n=1 Tax=Delitschia confertaspora ATCC 74209 TaxID=1513339 RepID=A0A9P4MWR8_9PLEO|nr:hypothetical protein GQ43DRAFT_369103 [Delitschia confertaspora ATCC 74209]
MISLLLVVFVLQLLLHIINTVGASTINQLLWILYNKLPTPTSKAAQEQPKLKREVLRLKRELAGVSAQDDFARWAKLRRQHDKAMAEFEKIDNSLRGFRTSFDTTVSTLRWLSTNGLRFLLQFWFAKQPMFWLPEGWLPGYVEWILSFPRAPKGAVSINVWGIACGSVIGLAAEAITAANVLATKAPAAKEKPQTFEADPKQRETKKEL